MKDGIRAVQRDFVSEFLGESDEYLKKRNIKHNFIYLKRSKINIKFINVQY